LQANIKEARFGLDFFKSFDLVLNGLDNMDARRHVNRLCVAAGVPLVESGTAGYVGQVMLPRVCHSGGSGVRLRGVVDEKVVSRAAGLFGIG